MRNSQAKGSHGPTGLSVSLERDATIDTITKMEDAGAHLPPAIIEKTAQFNIVQAKLLEMQQEWFQAKDADAEIILRMKAALQQCSERTESSMSVWYDRYRNRFSEWETRAKDLEEALQRMKRLHSTRYEACRLADIDLREQGQELVKMIETWLAELASLAVPPVTEPVIPYDPPFDMAMLASTEKRCAEQAKVDQEVEESSAELKSIPIHKEMEFGGGDRVDHCLSFLKSIVQHCSILEGDIEEFKGDKKNLENGGSMREDQPKDFDLNARLQ